MLIALLLRYLIAYITQVTGMSKLEINAIVSRLDKSKTGMVEFDEFWKW